MRVFLRKTILDNSIFVSVLLMFVTAPAKHTKFYTIKHENE